MHGAHSLKQLVVAFAAVLLVGTSLTVGTSPASAESISSGYETDGIVDLIWAAEHYGYSGPGEMQKAGVQVIKFLNGLAGTTGRECDLGLAESLDVTGPYVYESEWSDEEVEVLEWAVDHYCITKEQAQLYGGILLTFFAGLDAATNGTTAVRQEPPPVTTAAPTTTTVAPATTTTTVVPTTTTVATTTTLPPAVTPSTEATSANEAFFDLVRANETWDLGYTGAGSVVAIIDGAGFDASHSDFTGLVLLEVCTSVVAEKCPNGEDVAEGPGMAAYLPGGNHGTGVAGVVHQLAPDAEFIFISTMGSTVTNVGPAGTAYQWVIDNAEEYGIDALVMSYGSVQSERKARNQGLEACFDTQARDEDFATMQALGVVPVVSSGNDGRLGWIEAPSCLDHTVSVGWVNEYGIIHESSNVADGLTLLAPSELTAATIPENGLYEIFGGTSGAAPVVGALIAIGRQINPEATVDELIATARATGRSTDDYEVKDLRLVDFLAFSQTLASLPVSPKKETAFEIDAVTSLVAGTSLKDSELCAIGGFTVDCTSITPRPHAWLSGSTSTGSTSICRDEPGKIVGVSPGTCIYSIKLASYDHETKEAGPWETKVIQFDIVPLTADVITTTKVKVGVGVGASEIYSIGGFTFDNSGGIANDFSRISGSDSVCTVELGQVVGVSPGTCIYSIKLASYDHETKQVTGPWETKVIQFDVVPLTVDGVTSLAAGVRVRTSEIYSIGGFTFDNSGGTTAAQPSRISGSDSVCTLELGLIVGVSPGTCVYSIKLASYDHETKEAGPWETKIIQFNVTD